MKLIVTAPSGRQLVTGEALIEACGDRFGSSMRVQPSRAGGETDFHLYATVGDDSLILSHFADNASISFEANGPLLRETVAWYRSLLPTDSPRAIACDQGWNGHIDLVPGVTAEDIATRWVDHSVEGWNEQSSRPVDEDLFRLLVRWCLRGLRVRRACRVRSGPRLARGRPGVVRSRHAICLGRRR